MSLKSGLRIRANERKQHDRQRTRRKWLRGEANSLQSQSSQPELRSWPSRRERGSEGAGEGQEREELRVDATRKHAEQQQRSNSEHGVIEKSPNSSSRRSSMHDRRATMHTAEQAGDRVRDQASEQGANKVC